MTLPSYAMSQTGFPEMYEKWLAGPLFRPFAEILLEEVKLSQSDRVLDIACGTGVVARLANERLGGGCIVGVDVSPDMLGVARAQAPDIDWREGNAADLPLGEDEKFEVVVCQQGLQFFSDKAAAAAQMRRALTKDGRLAVSTWRSDEEIPFLRELRHVAERHLGAIDDQRHSFGDAALLETLLESAGFGEVRVRTDSHTVRFDDGATLVRLNAMALVGMSAAGKDMAGDERMHIAGIIADESAPVLRAYSDETGLAFEILTNLATGRG